MSSQFTYFKKYKVPLHGVIHVGAHRGEEVHQYAELGAKKIIWVEPNPDVFKEMEILPVSYTHLTLPTILRV